MLKIRTRAKRDIEIRVKWLNYPKVNQYIGDKLGQKTTLKKAEGNLRIIRKSEQEILYNDSGQNTNRFHGFSNIDKINKNADLFITISDDDYRAKCLPSREK